MKLRGQIAIITGASNGIGRSIAIEFSRERAKVLLIDIDSQKGKEIQKQIEHLGGEAQFLKCDVRDENQIKRCVRKILSKYESIDILVNNAGIFDQNVLAKTSKNNWDDIINTNLRGTFLFTKYVSEQMIKQKSGKIIMVSSIAGKAGLINTSAFSSANGGIINLMKELTLELSPHKINVNAVSPGIVRTQMIESLINDKVLHKKLLNDIPMNRFATPEEIADGVVFLASKDAHFITGHNLVIDGGWRTH